MLVYITTTFSILNLKSFINKNFLSSYKTRKSRILLIGDAAHSIHPFAGQGLNLGMRDVESVIRQITAAKSSGIDVGSNYLLKKISRDRYFDNFTMALATDGLNRIFSNRILCVKVLSNLGLMVVENSDFLKKSFVRHAMGFI
nr:FAD-dependent monooxygenase [Wolbachia endosymbiont (group B) of Pandemis cinnamomeana]